jgi:hypothetical protein
MTEAFNNQSNPDDRVVQGAEALAIMPEEIFGADLWKEVCGVVDQAHALLNGPDGNGQFDGTYETQRVCLDLPKGLLLAAAYAAIKRERGHRPHEWRFIEPQLEGGGEPWRRLLRNHLTLTLWNALQYELHLLATGDHPALIKEAKRRGKLKEPSKSLEQRHGDAPAGIADDDVPF